MGSNFSKDSKQKGANKPEEEKPKKRNMVKEVKSLNSIFPIEASESIIKISPAIMTIKTEKWVVDLSW